MSEQLSLDFDAVKEPREQWHPIQGYEGRYEVSNFGRVRSYLNGKHGLLAVPRYIKPIVSAQGYSVVFLAGGQNTRRFSIHTLVLEAFVGNRPHKYQCAHSDGNRVNNCLANLRWATPKENMADKKLHGTEAIGERRHNAKLTQSIADDIKKSRKTEGLTYDQLAERYNTNKTTVHFIVTGCRYVDEL